MLQIQELKQLKVCYNINYGSEASIRATEQIEKYHLSFPNTDVLGIL